jgi:lipase maturation factor 1
VGGKVKEKKRIFFMRRSIIHFRCLIFVGTIISFGYGFTSLSSLQKEIYPSIRRMKKVNIHPKFVRENMSPCVVSKRYLPSSGLSSSSLSLMSSSTSPYLESSMYLVRIIFLRALAFVYGVAFTVAYRQNKALLGDTGLTPARYVLDQAEKRGKVKRKLREEWATSIATMPEEGVSTFKRLKHRIAIMLVQNRYASRLREILWDRSDSLDRPLTTLLWLAKDRENLNPWLDAIALTGISMASLIFLFGAANVPLLLGLWICQRSLWAIGGPWYGFGWEAQLAELGFHALFLVPLSSLNPFSGPPVPAVVRFSILWFLFRIMMGAGLIKMKGGKHWKDLTAMNYHYETQPVPNPLSKYLHNLPKAWHRWEVLTNHFAELVAPWMLLLPNRNVRIMSGIIQMIFQSALILSGNLSFLNWLTAVPALFCFDDAFLKPFSLAYMTPFGAIHQIIRSSQIKPTTTRRLVTLLYGILVTTLSIPVIRNLLSNTQIMNGSFDPLRLIHTYGAFGTINEERTELVISSALDVNGEWKEYEFKVKPGSVTRPPRWISPYHYRLDWQFWIAVQLGSVDRSPWMFTLLTKLFESDKLILSTLLANDPWNGKKPKYMRIDRYRYKFHQARKLGLDDPYWDREYIGRWYPRQGVCTLESLKSDQILSRSKRQS